MGLLARFFEGKGVPTTSIYLQPGMTESVPSPRMLLVRWPFGHPYGEPHRPELQAQVVQRALSLAGHAPRFGYVDTPHWPWRRVPDTLPPSWKEALKEIR